MRVLCTGNRVSKHERTHRVSCFGELSRECLPNENGVCFRSGRGTHDFRRMFRRHLRPLWFTPNDHRSNAAQYASHSVYMQDMFLTHIVNVSNLYRTIQKYLENFQCQGRRIKIKSIYALKEKFFIFVTNYMLSQLLLL